MNNEKRVIKLYFTFFLVPLKKSQHTYTHRNKKKKKKNCIIKYLFLLLSFAENNILAKPKIV